MKSLPSLLLSGLLLTLSVVKVHAKDVDVSKVIEGLKLSAGAKVHLRGEEGYVQRTKRWQYWKAPDFAAVVEVATAEDVSETIKFANTHNVPFSAFSGGHGGISNLADVHNAIAIHMRRLNSITISPDGTYATVGGGAKVMELRDALWAADKWTTHGICECPGLVSVALGGGMGALEDRYGLLSDQFLSLDVVLANGTAIHVSETSHADLFWGMQGAGHNFGIVTALNYKVYDIPDSEVGGRTWSFESFVYEATPENVESVYGAAKTLMDSGEQPDGLLIYGVVGLDPDGSGKGVITHTVLYNGPLSSITPHTAPYTSIPHLSRTSEQGTFLDTSRWFAVDDASLICRLSDFLPGAGLARFPVDSKTYNVTALADAVASFVALIQDNAAFAGSVFLIEQYSTRAVRAVDPGKSAVPWRDNVLLVSPGLVYTALDMSVSPPAPNVELEELAWSKGREMQRILAEGVRGLGGHYSYVNYASGGESEAEMYGERNLESLRGLKRVYDPEGRFGFYGPISGGSGGGGGVGEGEGRERDEL
ncbi:FAD-binding domain-containing protein [Pyrenochaeta sp. DS3sAY3a]|nr:FAD-binding domain-containing protein [Pyrenochaeta sp. DS3sAY3a]